MNDTKENVLLFGAGLYNQMIFIHGSEPKAPFFEIPDFGEWRDDRNYLYTPSSILVRTYNISELAAGYFEVYHATNATGRVLCSLPVVTSHRKISISDHEKILHATLPVGTTFTQVTIGYDDAADILRLYVTLEPAGES